MANYQNRSSRGRSSGSNSRTGGTGNRSYARARNKSDSARNVIITLVALLLAMVIVLTIAIGSLGFTIKSPKDWFKHTTTADPTTDSDEKDGGQSTARTKVNGAVFKLLDSSGSLTHVFSYDELTSPTATTGDWDYYLTVTYDPKDATFQNTLFTASWKNPESKWANDKDISDYIEVKKVEHEETRATVTILQEFEEQIIITATCEKQPEIYCTTTVDFIYQFIDVTLQTDDMDSDIWLSENGTVLKGGTILPDFRNIYIHFYMNEDKKLTDALETAGFEQSEIEYEISDTPERIESVYYKGYDMPLTEGILFDGESFDSWFRIMCKIWNVPGNQETKFKNVLAKHYQGYADDDAIYTLGYGVVYKMAYKDVDFGWNLDNVTNSDVEVRGWKWLVTPADNITPSDPGFVGG